ncbi:glycosyltransferase family 87 protein [Nocardioides acrostichi]|uniref:DUF2029 domain-containing protein n=1 Tax=Nocardioides acrostichi TaxID=2784339 RepID=A0A930V4Y2_9ACTN|nr:glycosyltransferase 87 family protein [Nocardioides acrostichi]MBF4163921.1 DUF2029 domain-containing protein [Nocardioides acrostichi]
MTGPGRPALRDAVVAPTLDDPVVGRLSAVVGGPRGQHAGRHWFWTPVRVLLALTALCFVLGMAQKSGCYEDTWTNGQQRYTHMCYSDLPYLYTGRGLAERAWPYSEDPDVRARYPQVMEYPVGISYWAYGTALAAQALTGWPDLADRESGPTADLYGRPDVQREIRAFVIVNALGFAALALLATWLLAGVTPRRPWDAAAFAAAPVLALTALINWDLIAVAIVAGILWSWARDRPLLTGVLIGLGTAAKLYPLFLLGGLLVLCWRQRRWRDLALASVAAAVAWLVVDLPAMISGFSQWQVFWTFNSDRGADLGSIWLVIDQAFATTISPSTINEVSLVFFAAWCLGVLVLGLRAPNRPTFAQLGFLLVVGFLLVNKVYSPQYALWLLPFAVLARPRWRDQIVWQACEVLYFASVWWYLGGELKPGGGGDAGFYWLAIAVRMAGELYLVALIVRDLLRGPSAPRIRPDVSESAVPVGR